MEMADGKAVSAMIKTMIGARPSRLPLKRLEKLKPLFFPFSKILCAPSSNSDEIRTIPSPADVRRSVSTAIEERLEAYSDIYNTLDPEDRVALKGPRFAYSEREGTPSSLPEPIQRAISQRGESKTIKIRGRRPRIVLFSDPS